MTDKIYLTLDEWTNCEDGLAEIADTVVSLSERPDSTRALVNALIEYTKHEEKLWEEVQHVGKYKTREQARAAHFTAKHDRHSF